MRRPYFLLSEEEQKQLAYCDQQDRGERPPQDVVLQFFRAEK